MSLLLGGESWAQIGGGSIVGSLLDSSGGVIVGAKVTATNVGTNEMSATVTNETGYFEFPLLPAGRYVLEAEASGFERSKTVEFPLNSGTRPRFDLKMTVARTIESIQVVSSVPLVNATTADLGVVVDQSKVDALPLNGRDFQQLVGLQAGVQASPDTFVGQRGGMEFNGASAYGNNLLMDGVDMTFGENSAPASDKAAGSQARPSGNAVGEGIGRGALINSISVEAIQEFKATGSAFSAEYGRATGGVVNIITKSGTNQFHGTLFEFFRNDKLDANSFFSNLNGLSKPALRWNQFGGNLGGPIKHDKLFFFFNYEGARASQGQPVTGNVPTPLLLSMVTPAIQENLSLFPAPTSPTEDPLVGLHYRNARRTNTEDTLVARTDVQFGKQRLAFRYNYNRQDFLTPNLIVSNSTLFPTRFHNAMISDTYSVSPTLVNELRLGFNRVDEFRRDLGFATTPNFLTVSDVGISTSMETLRFSSQSYTVADNLTSVRGNHTLQTGFEIRFLRTRRTMIYRPSTTYLTLDSLIRDEPNSVSLSLAGQRKLPNTDFGFFIQDNWRVSKRLQINAGLRYEYFTPFTGGWNVQAADYLNLNPVYTASKSAPLYKPDRTNFSPRLGLVFDVTGDQKLVLRAGGALVYNPLQPVYIYDRINFMPDPRVPSDPSFLTTDVPAGTNLSFPFNPSFITQYVSNPSLLPPDLILGRSFVDPNRKDERAGTWNLSLQRALTSSLAVQVSYVGTRSWNQPGSRNLNLFKVAEGAVTPGGGGGGEGEGGGGGAVAGSRVVPNVGDVILVEFAGRSSYHALQFALNQRLQHGLTVDFYYAYAKSMSYYGSDSGAASGDNTVQDANNIRGSYGPKISDLRNMQTLVVSYALPSLARQSRLGGAFLSGWTIEGIQTSRSGLPLNVLAGVDEAGIATAGFQRPDLVPGVNPYVRNLNTMQWLNPAAFDNATPAEARRYGNLGFNALRGPSKFGFDMALHKTFHATEKQTITFRAEAFNVLNHVVFNLPISRVSNPTFGQITSGSGGRNVQLALKYQF